MTERDELLALADSIEGWGQTFGGKQSPGIVKIPLTKSDRAAIVAALRDLRARPAMPDDDEDVRTFDDGVQHTVLLLAKWLDAEGWEMCDGSEDYDTDLGNTLLSILAAKGLYDKDECKWASLTAPSQGDAGAREAAVERVARIIDPAAFKSWESLRSYALKEGDEVFANLTADDYYKSSCDSARQRAVTILASLATPSDAGETPVPPDAGWLAPALDKAASRAAEMPDWMTRSPPAPDRAALRCSNCCPKTK